MILKKKQKKPTGSEVPVGGSVNFFSRHMILQEQRLTGRAAIKDFICFQGSERKSRWSSAQKVQREKGFLILVIRPSIFSLHSSCSQGPVRGGAYRSRPSVKARYKPAVLTEINKYGKVSCPAADSRT